MDRRIAVFCASSTKSKAVYLSDAFRLGETIASHNDILVYGGGRHGLMGAVSDGALSAGGRVAGIIPEFMMDLEWGRDDISSLELTGDMESRKLKMIEGSVAIVVLPGGSGTMEELYQVLTMKRLGHYTNPVVIVNVNSFYDKWLEFMEHTVSEDFLGRDHLKMYTVVENSERIYDAIDNSHSWSEDDINKALV
ncbi:MAG: TIGR00730 family Rossman fold protein [Bacteroidetes bacterium]|nr:TIGR00730 family Rossman fold protein [Bacteroidota bacterium]